MITIDPHPLLDLQAMVTTWPVPLGEIETPPWLTALCSPAGPVPLGGFDEVRRVAVRDLLRHSGFKPSGRNKPCNEYIASAAAKGRFPVINPAVDATNAAVLHGGLPISTVDLPEAPWRVRPADPDASYVFNPSGQVIALGGLLCLHDGSGPCANAVKDAQRAKTTDGTMGTLSLVWGTTAAPEAAAEVRDWLAGVFGRLGGGVEVLSCDVERG